MSLKAFDKELNKGFKSPIYAIVSSDDFLLNDASRDIKKNIVNDDFNLEDYDLLDAKISLTRLLESLNMLPFMSGRKVVFIRHSEKLTKKELTTLEPYFSNPSSHTSLFMFFKVSDMRKPLSLHPNIKVINLSLSEIELAEWIDNRSKALGYQLTKQAIEYLINAVGIETGLINSEISKFSALNKEWLDISDISNLIYAGADYGAFELIAKIKQGDLSQSLYLFQRLSESIETYQLLGALCWDLVVRQGTTLDTQKMKDILKILHEADKLSKRTALCVMETTIIRLINTFRKI